MKWIPPEGKDKVPEFNKYIGGHVSADHKAFVEGLSKTRNVSYSALLRSMIEYCKENMGD